MSVPGQAADFLGLVHSPHFGRLGDRDYFWLNAVLITDSATSRAHAFDREFSLRRLNGDEFRAHELFRRTALVHVNMRIFGADDRLVGIGQRPEAKTVSGGSIKDKEDSDLLAEMAFEMSYGRSRIGVISISRRMSLVCLRDGLQNLGTDAGIVVARKAARTIHRPTI